ncbi:MAG: hypothetical protein IPG92_19015 [Flavobacteriales bacterium]|nr:hypothetical protein [Flavobacteriales bacterium]
MGSGFYADLAAHQAGTGMGAGDTDIDPVFPIQPDLHLNGCAMDDLGEYFFVVRQRHRWRCARQPRVRHGCR